ncbi:PTS mannose transporter subunit IID [Clostridium botulinum]|uniref:PTS mannose transporter subunit IID n=1 Tax=Clostridium botulinum C/D str. DC5 TaxID=1443128 RepID=A0A0A0IGU8_CLOBO|nr:PTS mannose transporter subunit IID [Clostridium botulinum]KEI00770.1 PTS mannose transporter subunit IID [Clostridium botulinum C/D str. BKT75002]KEI11708.1 PTS mannose transporter subunit IID [Clostridium botulinum C/D str. BKT2873]KGM95022.1 PTS mannose transporter subunit IID [Clostridium botulinum D str. CCUG 7971]KGN00193.1 PTS mannose transporter subunit IID [Clostridium botulinum C/D str. DC5]KOC50842.1 PTS mannose transporter subunit IID [Clostridium botulinum]
MKILIVGHGEYGTGIKSTMKILTGIDENIDALNLNDELTHEKYKSIVHEYVENNDELIIFADLTGGAPFQIASQEVLLNKSNDSQYVIGGVSVGCILDVVMNTMVLDNEKDIKDIINNAIDEVRDMVSIISKGEL